jgi:hypothetical protein
MRRHWWIAFKWENVQTFTGAEPVYLCTGFRDIAEATEAASQFDEMWRAKNGLVRLPRCDLA